MIPDEPLTLIKAGSYNKVPVMIGTNQNEGLLIKAFYDRNPSKYEEAFNNWKRVGPLAFFHREKDEVSPAESQTCEDYVAKHFGTAVFGEPGPGSELLVRMYGEMMFTSPADLVCRMMTAHQDSPPVYQYIYNHQGYVSLYDIIAKKPWQLYVKAAGLILGLPWFKSSDGVCHGDELFMMFKGERWAAGRKSRGFSLFAQAGSCQTLPGPAQTRESGGT